MELTKVFEVFAASIMMGIYFTYCGKRLLRKSVPLKFNAFLLIMILIFFITINYLFLDNALKMMTLYIVVLFIYKIIFK